MATAGLQSPRAAPPRRSVEALQAQAYVVPTDAPEGDGTLTWDSTTIVVVEARAGEEVGLGYTYADSSIVGLIESKLSDAVLGSDAMAPPRAWERMRAAIRNLGRPGLCSTAISAVDVALWDLKARLLGLPLAQLLGPIHERVPIYGSGGFTTYSDDQLEAQLAGWVGQGISRVKIKIGAHPEADPHRVELARAAIGPTTELFVDANGALTRKQALAFAGRIEALGVVWFEEPVSSDDLEGLALLRDRMPAPIAVAAGEYGYDLFYFRRMLEAGAVDVLQADVTRCGGITELLRVGALCAAHAVPFSAHTSPAIHAHACCAMPTLRHLEYFHDHVRIERMLFDGVLEPVDGALVYDAARPGLGIALRRDDAARYAA